MIICFSLKNVSVIPEGSEGNREKKVFKKCWLKSLQIL